MDNNILSWDEYFMGVALLSAKRSKDPKAKVGACIVNSDKKIIGVGYNGLPIGLDDNCNLYDTSTSSFKSVWDSDIKCLYVVHAEANAILNTTSSLKGATLYVSKFPCSECAKFIAQTGIKRVVYLESFPKKSSNDKWHTNEALLILGAAKIKVDRLVPTFDSICINFKEN